MSEISALRGNTAFEFKDFDAYLFDIDGTLLNSRDWVHYNAFHEALREIYGCEQKIDNVPVQGNTDVGILRAASRLCGVDDRQFASGLEAARKLMGDEVERNAAELRPELCESIRDLLERLNSAGRLMGVCTGNFERIGWAKLTASGVRDFFRTGSFSDNNEFRTDIFRDGVEKARTTLGSGARVCFIGDTPNDIAAARSLDIPVVAVATGIFTIDQLQEHGPTHCVGCCRELL